MNKTIHRGLYTRRILDIINSINKQKKGIDTVIQVRYSGITDNRYQPVKWGKMPASLECLVPACGRLNGLCLMRLLCARVCRTSVRCRRRSTWPTTPSPAPTASPTRRSSRCAYTDMCFSDGKCDQSNIAPDISQGCREGRVDHPVTVYPLRRMTLLLAALRPLICLCGVSICMFDLRLRMRHLGQGAPRTRR